MYPYLDDKQWASVKIGAGLFAASLFLFKFMTGTSYEQKDIIPAPLPSTEF